MTPTVAYLADPRRERAWTNSIQSIVLGYKEVAAGKVRIATENIERRVAAGAVWEDAWNSTSIELVQAAEVNHLLFLILLRVNGRVHFNQWLTIFSHREPPIYWLNPG